MRMHIELSGASIRLSPADGATRSAHQRRFDGIGPDKPADDRTDHSDRPAIRDSADAASGNGDAANDGAEHAADDDALGVGMSYRLTADSTRSTFLA
jgi:hypothetical protein